jgi:hypothetical protein
VGHDEPVWLATVLVENYEVCYVMRTAELDEVLDHVAAAVYSLGPRQDQAKLLQETYKSSGGVSAGGDHYPWILDPCVPVFIILRVVSLFCTVIVKIKNLAKLPVCASDLRRDGRVALEGVPELALVVRPGLLASKSTTRRGMLFLLRRQNRTSSRFEFVSCILPTCPSHLAIF